MKIHEIEKDIEVACIPAINFPHDIVAAHEKLHDLLPYRPGREYYGISWGDGKGGIVYKAASTMLAGNEAALEGLEIFTIKKGKYLCEILENYRQNIPGIKAAFASLLADPRIAPDGFCLEAKMIEKDLWCMVKLND
jgi:hypothetical protein